MTKQVRICHVQIIDVRQVYVLVVADGQMPFQRFSGVQNVRCRFTRRIVRFVDFEAINGQKRRSQGDTILVPKVELRPEYRK